MAEDGIVAVYSLVEDVDMLTPADSRNYGYTEGKSGTEAFSRLSDWLGNGGYEKAYAVAVKKSEFYSMVKGYDYNPAILYHLKKNKGGLRPVSASISRGFDE